MEKDELKNIWVDIQGVLIPKTRNELKEILIKKSRHVIGKFLKLLVLDVAISVGLLIFLVIASINRGDDVLYLLHNGIHVSGWLQFESQRNGIRFLSYLFW